MPYRWSDEPECKTLTLWAHQSMTAPGFAWFIGLTAALLAMPLLAVLGSPVIWILLIFLVLAVWGVWHAIMTNRRHRSMHEVLTIEHEKLRLIHVPADGAPLDWEANPYWTTVHLNRNGPVENYLTLKGAGREVELGAFLTPEERQALYDELHLAIRPD